MPHYDHSDNWYLVHSVHLNNLDHNMMDSPSCRNVSSTGATVFLRSVAVVLPPEGDEDVELEDVVLPEGDAASYPRSIPDLFPVVFFANTSFCVCEIINTDEIIARAKNTMNSLVLNAILLLFINGLLFSVFFSFHISIFEFDP